MSNVVDKEVLGRQLENLRQLYKQLNSILVILELDEFDGEIFVNTDNFTEGVHSIQDYVLDLQNAYKSIND